MKEKLEKVKEFLAESTTISNRELVLALAVGVLGGIVFGLLTSPRKTTTIGSNNGSNNHDLGEISPKKKKDWQEIDEKEAN